MSAPALAVARRGEQAIYKASVRIRAGVVEERLDGIRFGRQTVQAISQSSNQCRTISFGRGGQTVFRELRGDEVIDFIDRLVVAAIRYGRLYEWAERPPRPIRGTLGTASGGPFCNPGTQEFNFLPRQRVSHRRHQRLGAGHLADEQAAIRVSGIDRRTALSSR